MNCPASLPFILSTCVALLLADGALADEIRSGNVAVVRMSVQQTEQQLAGWLRDAGIEPGRSEAALAVWRKGLAGASTAMREPRTSLRGRSITRSAPSRLPYGGAHRVRGRAATRCSTAGPR